MSSGIAVARECVDAWSEFKVAKKYGYLILKFNSKNTEVIVDECGDRSSTFDDFREKLIAIAQQKEGRFAFFDFRDKKYEGDKNETGKILGFTWVDDDLVPMRQKMLFPTTVGNIMAAFEGCSKFSQVNSSDDLTEKELRERSGFKEVK